MSSLLTEGVNELTKDIDVMNSEERVRALIQVDKDMFSQLGGLVEPLTEFSKLTYETLREEGLIIYQGAGTSGRIAKHSANEYEALIKAGMIFKPRNFKGSIAGGYPALVRSVEGAEDDAAQGAQDILTLLEGVDNALYVSISCSGGAKCNLGGLEAALMEQQSGKKVNRVAILFNELVKLDNQTIIEAIGKTPKEVYEEFTGKDLIINPVLGPEAIAGSTRMKGGSITQLILDVSFNTAIHSFLEGVEKSCHTVRNFLRGYKQCMDSIEKVEEQLVHVVDAATTSLQKGGHIYYLGDHHFGRLGITDASEIPPTFGASQGEVQGFMMDGWGSFLPLDEVVELDEKMPFQHPLSLEDFEKKKLGEHDLVILLGRQYPKVGVDHRLLKTFEDVKGSGAQTASLILDGSGEGLGVYPQMRIDHYEFFQGYDNYVMKFLLNTISTSAYVGVGKTYGNKMIDLHLSNDKLVERGIRIINSITGHDHEFIAYHLNQVTKLSGKTDYKGVDHLIPTTLLVMAGLEFDEAVEKLDQSPIIRNVLASHWAGNVTDFKKHK